MKDESFLVEYTVRLEGSFDLPDLRNRGLLDPEVHKEVGIGIGRWLEAAMPMGIARRAVIVFLMSPNAGMRGLSPEDVDDLIAQLRGFLMEKLNSLKEY